jgi:AraC-like DNA-binding protein
MAVDDGTIGRSRHMSAETSMSVLTARPVVAALEARGVDAARVLRLAELSSDALTSADARLPCVAVLRLWEEAAAAAGDPSFGVHVAEALPAGAYDVYEHILSAAETVGDGLARLTRYIPLLHDRSTLTLVVEPAHGRLVRRVPAIGPQYDEFSVALMLVRSRHASGTEWRPERVTFQHDLTHDAGELSRVFGCPLAFGSAETELLIPRAVLELPHPRADATLLSVLSGHVDPLLEALPPRGVLLARVSTAIARRMSTSLPTLADMAAAVRVPERTLQRRLAEEGVSFSALVDDVRRNLAFEALADPRLSVTEIALRLHFADPAAFYRAFKRWTGESPVTYRRRFL